MWWLFWAIVTPPCFWIGFISITTYLVPLFLQNVVFDNIPVNLKKKYKAEWAVVTGASSGIGRAFTEKLVKQEINVVLVALQNDLLDKFFEELQSKHKNLQFRKVGVDLSRGDYMTPIIEATKDINPTLIFNNAGFITAGFFADVSLDRQLGNYECNATACVKITHHFLNTVQKSGAKGFFAFTSSSAGFVPNPLSSMYSSTKAFMSMFATSIAAEVRSSGIDVCVVHPSPMATNFFDNAGKLGALLAFKRFAVTPDVIADVVFNSAGRFVVRDQGLITILFKILLKALDLNLMCEIIARTSHMSGDFKEYNKKK